MVSWVQRVFLIVLHIIFTLNIMDHARFDGDIRWYPPQAFLGLVFLKVFGRIMANPITKMDDSPNQMLAPEHERLAPENGGSPGKRDSELGNHDFLGSMLGFGGATLFPLSWYN